MKLDSVFDLPCECNFCEPDQSFWCKGCRLENVPYFWDKMMTTLITARPAGISYQKIL